MAELLQDGKTSVAKHKEKNLLVFFFSTCEWALMRPRALSHWHVDHQARCEGSFTRIQAYGSKKRTKPKRIKFTKKVQQSLKFAIEDAKECIVSDVKIRYAYFRRMFHGMKDPRKPECQVKGCWICLSNEDQSSILLCDNEKHCNREYHMGCLNPPLTIVPSGNWYCPRCEKFLSMKKKSRKRGDGEHDEKDNKKKRRKNKKKDGANHHLTNIERTEIRIGDEFQATIPSLDEMRRQQKEKQGEFPTIGGVKKSVVRMTTGCTHRIDEPCPKYSESWDEQEYSHYSRSLRNLRSMKMTTFHELARSLKGRCDRSLKELIHRFYTVEKKKEEYRKHFGFFTSSATAQYVFMLELWPRLEACGWTIESSSKRGANMTVVPPGHEYARVR